MGEFDNRFRPELPGSGPFIAEVVKVNDPTLMGGMQVALIKSIKVPNASQYGHLTVRYLSPFFGSTSRRFEGNNSGDFNDVQKSYGMWMVPPDLGTFVMVIFIDGDTNQGYWIGCVPQNFQNHMVPGIAASTNSSLTPLQAKKYGGMTNLPVAEVHNKSQLKENPNIDSLKKAVHPFSERLLAQGLLNDNIRGTTSSSARREAPSQVFGISTPGPLDTASGAPRKSLDPSIPVAPVSRLGGTTFVMDDGDARGQNELVRIRTRTGHQILLHNTHDLIYIANSRGTSWIELTSDGKIDIYSKDSVSIHTENDFNFRADRDINLEAGRNINIRSIKNMETNIGGHYRFVVDKEANLQFKSTKDEIIDDASKIKVGKEMNLSVLAGLNIQSAENMNILSKKDIKQKSENNFDISAGAAMNQGSGANFNIAVGGVLTASAPTLINLGAAVINLAGGQAAKPSSAGQAKTAEPPTILSLFKVPNIDTEKGWASGNFYKTDDIETIMKRVPTHEPWQHHESIDSTKFTPSNTDSSAK